MSSFAPTMSWVPPQSTAQCLFGHRLHDRNIAMDMRGKIICLQCIAHVGDSHTDTAGKLIAIMLDLSPFPTREQVYAS